MGLTSGQQFRAGGILASRYEIIGVLGAGAVGTVLHVLDRQLDYLPIALKVLHSHLLHDDRIIQRFAKETLFARQLVHPNIVRVYEYEQLPEGYHCLSMELVEGCSLAQLMSSNPLGRFSYTEASFLLKQIASGLAFAHQGNVVHRDLNPENILVDRGGNVRISDFGIATSFDDSLGLTRSGETVGTPAYMAPEQLLAGNSSNKIDQRTDIYSFGVIAFELLTGNTPFSAEGFYELANKTLHAETPIEDLHSLDIPEWYCEIVQNCMQKDPKQRPQNIQIVQSALRDSNSENSRSVILSAVRKQNGFSIISSKLLTVIFGIWGAAALISAFCLTAYNNSSYSRIGVDLMILESSWNMDLTNIKSLVGFANRSLNNPDLCSQLNADDDQNTIRAMHYAGLEINPRLPDGSYFAHKLAATNQNLLAELLSLKSANIETPSKDGETLLLTALREGNLSSATKIIMHNPDPVAEDNWGYTPVLRAIMLDEPSTLNSILRPSLAYNKLIRGYINRNDVTALHFAAVNSKPEMLKVLLSNHFNPNMRNSKGETALMHVCKKEFSDSTRKVAKLLIDSGASLRARDDLGLSVFDHLSKTSKRKWTDFLRQSASSDFERAGIQ